MAVVYLGGAALVYRLVRRAEGRRALTVLLLTAIPVVAFAYKWQGGDPERYLALYPALFVTLALALSSLPQQAGELVAMLVIVVFATINIPAMSRTKAAAECAALTARVASIPHMHGRTPIVVTPHALDPILEYRARCPDVALASVSQVPQVFGLVMPHAEDAPKWRASLADRATRAWDAGDHVWASRRAFAPRPSASWDWTEGDDPRVHWRDFPAFFNRLDTGVAVGGADGFVEILPTSKNRRFMEQEVGADPANTAGARANRSQSPP